ncbi:MAG: desulfoferrodoxin [Oscillospiraceae bacterium]|nr:desulfoferrodoxin [Oscillospiraceae bacterium]
MKFYTEDKGTVLVSEKELNGLRELIPNTTDAAGEKHVPVISADGNTVTVTVGAVEHPMLEAHFIQWILLETTDGYQKKALKPGEKPRAVFALAEGEKAAAAYEYCNLHGLWKAEA